MKPLLPKRALASLLPWLSLCLGSGQALAANLLYDATLRWNDVTDKYSYRVTWGDQDGVKRDLDYEFHGLCKRDKARCLSVAHRPNTDPNHIQVMNCLAPSVRYAADLFGVDRVALMAILSFYFDHNQEVYRDGWYRECAINGPAGLSDQTSNYSRLALDSAEMEQAEPKVAAREGRPPRASNYYSSVNPSAHEEILAVASILSDLKQEAEAHGVDLAAHPERLTEMFLDRTKKSYLSQLVKPTEEAKDGWARFPRTGEVYYQKNRKYFENLVSDRAKLEPTPAAGKDGTRYHLKEGLAAYPLPVDCFGLDGNNLRTTTPFYPVKELLLTGAAMTCNGEKWVLARSTDPNFGGSGWIAERALRQHSTASRVPRASCTPAVNDWCRTSIEKAIGTRRSELLPNGRLLVHVSKQDPKPGSAPDWRKSGIFQPPSETAKKLQKAWESYRWVDASEIEGLKKRVADFKKKVASDYKLSPWGEGYLPFRQSVAEQALHNFQVSCLKKDSKGCILNREAFDGWFSWFSEGYVSPKATNASDSRPRAARKPYATSASGERIDPETLKAFPDEAAYRRALEDRASEWMDLPKEAAATLFDDLDACDRAIPTSPKARSLVALIQIRILEQAKSDAGYFSVPTFVQADKNNLRKLNILKQIRKDLDPLLQLCLKRPQDSPLLVAGAQPVAQCQAVPDDFPREPLEALNRSILALASPSDPKADEALRASLEKQLPAQLSHDLDDADLRMDQLLYRVQSQRCAKATWVSQPWLASPQWENRVFRPAEPGQDPFSFIVDVSPIGCQGDDS